MKILSTYKDFINESVRDKMTPRHEDDIRQSFIDRGYSFRHELLSASFISDVESVDQILELMYDVYKTTDSDEIKEIIEDDFVAGLDTAVKDGNYDTIESYLSYDIPGLGMSHLWNLLDYNYAGAAELVYDELKDGMSDEERKEVETKIAKMRLNESVRDKMTPKSRDEIKSKINKMTDLEKKELMDKFIYRQDFDGILSLLNSGMEITPHMTRYARKHQCLSVISLLKHTREWRKERAKIAEMEKERTNEGIRDMMTPKTEEEIERGLDELYKKWASGGLGGIRLYNMITDKWLEADETEKKKLEERFPEYKDVFDGLRRGLTRKTNESLRDKMTPKSSDTIRKDMLEYFEKNKMHGINKTIAKTNVFDSSDVVFCVEYWEDYFYDINNYLINVTNNTKELHQLTDNLGVYVCYPEVKVIEYVEKGEESTCWYFSQEHIEPIIDYMLSENARKEAV